MKGTVERESGETYPHGRRCVNKDSAWWTIERRFRATILRCTFANILRVEYQAGHHGLMPHQMQTVLYCI